MARPPFPRRTKATQLARPRENTVTPLPSTSYKSLLQTHTNPQAPPPPPPRSGIPPLLDPRRDVPRRPLPTRDTPESRFTRMARIQVSEFEMQSRRATSRRFFDIRLAVKNGALQAYHGVLLQDTPFPLVLSSISTFLAVTSTGNTHPLHPTRTSIKLSALLTARKRHHGAVHHARGMVLGEPGAAVRRAPWFFDEPRPQNREETHHSEGECFSSPAVLPSTSRVVRMGWKPERWPDSALDGFTWHAQETPCRTQDWYEIYGFFNIPAKFNVLTDHLLVSADLPRGTNLTLSFASAASIPLAVPPLIANGLGFPRWGMGFRGVNARLRDWLLDRLEALEGENEEKEDAGGLLRGIVPMDFYKGAGLVELMVAFNVVQTHK
ncbi:hypothetical protein QFC20_004380 [Naganishia adeliensis]|uniref:Uncharacterized protein n=1 Tax=Naganishia adeliensis TaxID=92952 RepID=A0ACC2W1A6_9TREE|nr:hypothetical protein QFC20_004380 [Naganishia adeliensis]